jgi:hypothetical protein
LHCCPRTVGNRPRGRRLKNPDLPRYPIASSAHAGASALTQLSVFKVKVAFRRLATLAKSTNTEAACKRRRSSEIVRIFLLEFHRKLYSCLHCCIRGPSALLKECESSKEKAPICSENGAAQKRIFRSPDACGLLQNDSSSISRSLRWRICCASSAQRRKRAPVAKGLTRWSAKPVFAGSTPARCSTSFKQERQCLPKRLFQIDPLPKFSKDRF